MTEGALSQDPQQGELDSDQCECGRIKVPEHLLCHVCQKEEDDELASDD